MIELKKYSSRDLLIAELSVAVVEYLKNGVDNRGTASMLLSGGSTPGPLYDALSNIDFEWNKGWFAPTDERWVEPDHADSNERLIRNTLLKNKAVTAKYIGLKSEGDNASAGAPASEEKLKLLPMPLDVVLLGMGEDGHFASLFPGLEDTKVAMDLNTNSLCHPVRRGGDDHDRMTMTYRAILNAKQIIVLCFGQKKLDVVENAARKVSDQLPISHLFNQSDVPVSLYWAE